jgi:hypothetical protein
MKICECCGQEIRKVKRLGVFLTPIKSLIFDIVKSSGKYGIWRDSLFDRTQHLRRNGAKHHTVRSHVAQINDLIEDTGYIIVATRGKYPVYRLIKRSEWKRPTRERNCVICGSKFVISKTQNHRRKTCGQKCLNVLISRISFVGWSRSPSSRVPYGNRFLHNRESR